MAYTRPSGDATDFSFAGLAYTRPLGDAVDFSFAPVTPPEEFVELNITGSFAPLTVSVRIAPSRKVTVTGSFAPLTVSMTAEYVSNTARPTVNQLSARHQDTGRVQNGVDTNHHDATLTHAGWHSPHTYGEVASVWIESKTPQTFRRVKDLFLSNHEAGTPVRPGVEVRHQDADRTLRLLLNSAFEAASLRRTWTTFRHQDGTKTRTERRTAHQEASLTGRWIVTSAQLATPLSRAWYVEHEAAMRSPPGISFPYVKPPTEPEFICYTPDGNLLFAALAPADSYLLFVCENHIDPPDGEPVVVPIRRVYFVINNVSLNRLPDGLPVPVFSLSLALDAASWTWGFEALLPAAAESLVTPGSNGGPVELVASVNGTPFRVLAESISRERVFGDASVRISGRGRNAVLAAPYAPVMNFQQPQPRTARQLMDDVLTLNGIPLGWNIDWGLTDWSVPAGVFTQQGTWMEALVAIANAAGGYLIPHPSEQSIRVRHRYPAAPWEWGAVTPDFVLPVDAVARESLRWVEKPAYNRVFVSGQEVGVLGQVTRAGTAGEVLAPMVVDALITEAAAARQRGIAVLADTGPQIEVSLRLPVLAETGVIQPGAFVEYQDGSQGSTIRRLGLVRSTQIEAGFPEVWQTLGVQAYA